MLKKLMNKVTMMASIEVSAFTQLHEFFLSKATLTSISKSIEPLKVKIALFLRGTVNVF